MPVEVDGRRFSVRVWLPEAPVVAAGARRARGAHPPEAHARAARAHGGGGDGTVTAPMQGTIVQVLVEVGAQVEVGQAILVLEAMKMENHINAERAGRGEGDPRGRRATRSAPATSSPSSSSDALPRNRRRFRSLSE